MEVFSLDMRTLNFIMILFSCIYCIGLLLYQRPNELHPNHLHPRNSGPSALSRTHLRDNTQRSTNSVKGLKVFALALLAMGAGPLLISFRGFVSEWFSIVVANMLITFAFQMLLHGLCSFRESTFRYSYACMTLIPIVFGLFVYFTYIEPSISARIVVIASYLVIVSFASVKALQNGTRYDLPLAVKMMSGTYFLYGLFMLFRGYHTIASASVTEFMSAGLVHQLTFLFSIFLIVSISFCMLWMINARQLYAINELSFYDSLTKIRNRRALDLFVHDLKDRKDKTPRPMSLIMLDIDHFKCINDEYGHVVGDRVIQTVSGVLRNTLPSHGSMFRYGGDEVIIVLDDHDIKVTANLAERLRQKIEHAPYVDNLAVQPTCSFGVAQIHGDESWDSAVSRADKALYQAKKNGRNTVYISPMAQLKQVYA